MIETLTSPALARLPGLRHSFFTRRGGVSKGIWASLNVGLGSADDPGAVAENRRRVAQALGGTADDLRTLYQIHSGIVVEAGPEDWSERPRADGLVSRAPGVILAVLAADCAPVLLADGEAGVVGAAHAGWRGALAGVVEATVAAMAALGARRERIVAAVGPCIGSASYEVGPEFVERFEAADAAWGRFFAASPGDPGKRRFDLPGFVLGRLAAAGIAGAQWLGRDTCAEAGTFFSNRRAHRLAEPDYGRLASAIALAR